VLLEILVELSAIIAGSSTGLLLYLFGADALSTVAVGTDVAIAVQLVRLIRGYRGRSRCRRTVAFAVRSILDTHLELTRIDPVGFGDYVTLRHLAAAADERRLDLLVSFGGPAHTLGRVIQELAAWLEDETGRCYHELRGADRRRVDRFADALRLASSACAAMLHAPPYDADEPDKASGHLRADLAAALVAVVGAGDRLDRAFDRGASRGAADARERSAAEKQRVEGHAAAVLLKTARDAAQTLQLAHVQSQIPMVPLPELLARLSRASEQMRDVDARAFHEATHDARNAFRRIHHFDVGEALDALRRLATDASDANAEEVLRDRLARFPGDLATLEGVRDGRVRDVAPWPGARDVTMPTLRAQ